MKLSTSKEYAVFLHRMVHVYFYIAWYMYASCQFASCKSEVVAKVQVCKSWLVASVRVNGRCAHFNVKLLHLSRFPGLGGPGQ